MSRSRTSSRSRTPAGITGVVTALLLVLALAAPAGASPQGRWPDVIDLPVGFQPEGIVVTPAGTAYAGSLADGSIIAANLRTGRVTEVYAADGTPAVGIEHDPQRGLLYVAGGASGLLEVVDPRKGRLLDRVRLTEPDAGFINDVAVDDHRVYATESTGDTLYAVQRGRRGLGGVRAITLTGDFQPIEGFNANGIVTLPDGSLIIVQSATGTLFRVHPRTGRATAVALEGAARELPAGDGIEREGGTLYVVQNRLNRVAVVELDRDPTTATVERFVTDRAFDVPTTVDRFEGRLYVVNARFGIEDPAEAAYQIVGTDRC